MPAAEWLWMLPLVVIVGVSGVVIHEFSHFAAGYAFGGGPFVSRTVLGVPVEVGFRTPGAMADWQVRVVGGGVYLWPALLFALMAAAGPDTYRYLWPVLVLFAGASGVSWTDGLALRNPTLWKKLAAGEPVPRRGSG